MLRFNSCSSIIIECQFFGHGFIFYGLLNFLKSNPKGIRGYNSQLADWHLELRWLYTTQYTYMTYMLPCVHCKCTCLTL